jgi:tetratricopeptide (TPR) repeat protein
MPLPDFEQAYALQLRGDRGAAEVLYKEILTREPAHFDALHMLGVIAAQTNRSAEAVHWLDRAIRVNGSEAAVHFNRAAALQQLGNIEPSIAGYDRAIALDSRFAEAYSNRGLLLQQIDATQAALDNFDRAIQLRPGFAEAHFNRGCLLMQLRQWRPALDSLDRAIASSPGYWQAHCNRGTAQRELDDPDGALASYDRAIALRADYALAHCNRGNVLAELRRVEEAVASYDRALDLQPGYAEAHFNRACALLAAGALSRAWSDYEWRWQNASCSNFRERRDFHAPLWLGHESLAGRTILLHAEQGLGDTLQFCRYARLVVERGARVILEVQAPLVPLLRRFAQVAAVIARGDTLPDFDYHCPLLSLPRAFATTLDSIPASSPYLHADAARVAHWQARLGEPQRKRIGLAWCGNPSHGNDRRRSLTLTQLIAALPAGLRYISLHQDLRPLDERTLVEHPEIEHFGADRDGFEDTAALSDCMDLIISVDTSLAHLGGALGKRTWVLLPFNADWRWLLDRTDSPWYPTVTLYRQPRAGDWPAVFDAVRTALARV